MEFWKKENGDSFEINSPILSQRYGLKLSHHPYLTHLNGPVQKNVKEYVTSLF